MERNQPPPSQYSPQLTLDLLGFTALSAMTALVIFTRAGFGRRALWGANVLFALLFILIFGACAPEPLMWPYFVLWFAALLIQRAYTEWLIFRGGGIYSHWFGQKFHPLAEPALCFLGGPLLQHEGHNIGMFLIACGVGIFVSAGLERLARAQRVQGMIDGEIENELLDQDYRG